MSRYPLAVLTKLRSLWTKLPRWEKAVWILVVLCLLLIAPAADAGELSRDEQRWAKVCIKNLGSNSRKVRSGAEQALIALGSEALETLWSESNTIKGRAAESGLGRVLAGTVGIFICVAATVMSMGEVT